MPTRQSSSLRDGPHSPGKSAGKIFLLSALLPLAGCALFLRDTPTPIPTRAAQASPTGPASTLVVFLPGRKDAMDDFDRNQFRAVLREAGIQADTIAVDAHLGYYFNRTVIERLRADVLLPARAQGYRRIVLVGVSLGGLGALLIERDAPGLVDEIVLLAPYLGENARRFEEIRMTGGPAAWAVGREPITGQVEDEIWTFLGNQSSALPSTWLLYGQDDSLAEGHQMLATLLPSKRVRSVPGDHDWATWLTLWRELCLNSELFAAERVSSHAVRTDPADGMGRKGD